LIPSEDTPVPRPPAVPIIQRLLNLLGPVTILAALFPLAKLLHPESERYHFLWGAMVAYVVSPIGKFMVVPLHAKGYGILEMTLLLGTIDFAFGLFLTINFDLLYRIPFFGGRLKKIETHGRRFLDSRPWMRRAAFWGLVLWTAAPVQGTGAISGSLIGRLLGMRKQRIIGAIAIGGYSGIFVAASLTAGLSVAFQRGLDWGLFFAILTLNILYILWAGYWSPWRHPHERAERDRV
jgi:uncharacterized membrane protein